MKCEKCGTEFEGNFCPNCGTPSEAGKNICPRCGQARSGADRFCKNCGYDFHQSEKSLKTSAATAGGVAAAIKRVPKKVWIRIAIALAVVAVLLAVLIPTISHFTNKFRIGVVEQISIGDSKERVIELLGEPYNYNADSATFEYYSDNYLKLLEENDSFNPDDIEDWDDFENAFDDALALEKKLQTEQYSYICVTFDRDGNVASVLLDASRTEQTKNAAKEVSQAELLTDDVENFLQAYADGSLAYYAQYTDGSYYMSLVPANAQEIEETRFYWTDPYGNRCQWNMGFNWENGWYGGLNEAGDWIVYIFCDNVKAPGDATCVVILDGVTSIEDWAFYNNVNLTSITIPDSVTSIGSYAFEDCSSLTSITIPDSVTSIGEWSFVNCDSLASITLPNSVTNIGEGAFASCDSLASITLPNSVTNIGEGAFEGCNSLASITVTSGNSVYHSAGNCLIATDSKTLIAGCKNSVIPTDGSVTSIGDSAFQYCRNLTSITIPDSVTSIGYGAFESCSSLTSISIPDSVTSIEGSAFAYCGNLTSVTIGNGVTSIGSWVFEFCSGLENITVTSGNPVYHSAGNCLIETERKTLVVGCKNSIIPTDDSVTSIGGSAFRGCSSLTSITIPDCVTSIEGSAFSGCSSLTSISIPDSVTSIGKSVFYNCRSLTSITIPDSVTSIGSSAFEDTAYYNDAVNWENDVLYIGNHLIEARETLSGEYTIKQDTKTIADLAFGYCDSLTIITIPESVTSIGRYAFSGCESLTSVIFEDLEGWYVTQGVGATSGTDLASGDLSDPATAARYLRGAYIDYYWYKR